VGVGDFNNDGMDDVLWRDDASGRNAIWRSGNASLQTAVTPVASSAWRVAAVAEFDDDMPEPNPDPNPEPPPYPMYPYN